MGEKTTGVCLGLGFLVAIYLGDYMFGFALAAVVLLGHVAGSLHAMRVDLDRIGARLRHAHPLNADEMRENREDDHAHEAYAAAGGYDR